MTAGEFLAYWTRITLQRHCEDAPERAPEKAVQCLQKKGGESSSQGEKYVTTLTGPAARAIMDALNEKAGLNYYEVSRGGETVVIVNESDCIKIKPKGWMEKKEWREIHGILRVQGFNWLSNGKDSCWTKMMNAT